MTIMRLAERMVDRRWAMIMVVRPTASASKADWIRASVTEARIQSAFDALAVGRTTLIIAHRLSTIRSANRIIVIDDNRIVEEGTHAQLMASGGEYAALYNAQKSVAV